MKIFDWIKAKTQTENYREEITEQPHSDSEVLLSVYEVRRDEIADSTRPVEGIFYLHDGKIICDYYSECIEPEDVDRKKQMYHRYFYRNYMRRKYPELALNPEHVPRGRTSLFGTATLFIDECYCNDQELIEKIKGLYRLPDSVMIIGRYNCARCRSGL
ncbi:MAG: hypothetical protein ACRDBO_04925 [Lachnospiraceae bacterium]